MSLRKLTENDLENILEWRNSPEVRHNMYNYNIISLEEHKSWFQSLEGDESKQYFIFEINNEPLGVVAFTEIDHKNQNASWAFYLGNSKKHGAGIKMEKEALQYAFTMLGIEKLWCEVLSFNDKVIKLHQHFGFNIEGIFKSHYKRDDTYHDIFRLALFKNEWEQRLTKK